MEPANTDFLIRPEMSNRENTINSDDIKITENPYEGTGERWTLERDSGDLVDNEYAFTCPSFEREKNNSDGGEVLLGKDETCEAGIEKDGMSNEWENGVLREKCNSFEQNSRSTSIEKKTLPPDKKHHSRESSVSRKSWGTPRNERSGSLQSSVFSQERRPRDKRSASGEERSNRGKSQSRDERSERSTLIRGRNRSRDRRCNGWRIGSRDSRIKIRGRSESRDRRCRPSKQRSRGSRTPNRRRNGSNDRRSRSSDRSTRSRKRSRSPEKNTPNQGDITSPDRRSRSRDNSTSNQRKCRSRYRIGSRDKRNGSCESSTLKQGRNLSRDTRSRSRDRIEPNQRRNGLRYTRSRSRGRSIQNRGRSESSSRSRSREARKQSREKRSRGKKSRSLKRSILNQGRSRSRDKSELNRGRNGSRDKRSRSRDRSTQNREKSGSRDKTKSRSRDRSTQNRDGYGSRDKRSRSRDRNTQNRERSGSRGKRRRSQDRSAKNRGRCGSRDNTGSRSRERRTLSREKRRSLDKSLNRGRNGSRDKRSRSRDKSTQNREGSESRDKRSRSRDRNTQNQEGSESRDKRSRSRDRSTQNRGSRTRRKSRTHERNINSSIKSDERRESKTESREEKSRWQGLSRARDTQKIYRNTTEKTRETPKNKSNGYRRRCLDKNKLYKADDGDDTRFRSSVQGRQQMRNNVNWRLPLRAQARHSRLVREHEVHPEWKRYDMAIQMPYQGYADSQVHSLLAHMCEDYVEKLCASNQSADVINCDDERLRHRAWFPDVKDWLLVGKDKVHDEAKVSFTEEGKSADLIWYSIPKCLSACNANKIEAPYVKASLDEFNRDVDLFHASSPPELHSAKTEKHINAELKSDDTLYGKGSTVGQFPVPFLFQMFPRKHLPEANTFSTRGKGSHSFQRAVIDSEVRTVTCLSRPTHVATDVICLHYDETVTSPSCVMCIDFKPSSPGGLYST